MRAMTRGFAATALFLATLYGAPAAAQGAPPPTGDADKAAQVQKLNDEGSSFYHARDYRRANEKFQQAYALDPDPNILYNIAKTYEHLGEDPAAIEKYEQFINDKGADPNGRAKAQEAVRMIRQRLEAKKNPQGGGATTGGGGTGTAPPPANEQTLVVPTIVAAGIGVVGLGVGTVFGITALGQKSDLDSACADKACPPAQNNNISDLKSSSTISTIGFVVGGVGLAAAALLYIAGRPSSKEVAKTGIRVTPLAGPTSVGLAGTF